MAKAQETELDYHRFHISTWKQFLRVQTKTVVSQGVLKPLVGTSQRQSQQDGGVAHLWPQNLYYSVLSFWVGRNQQSVKLLNSKRVLSGDTGCSFPQRWARVVT